MIDVPNLRRTDLSQLADEAAANPSHGQQPIVLARLPHVGAASAAATTAAPAPTSQVVPPPTSVAALDLHAEIDQHIKLHVADPPAPQPTPSAPAETLPAKSPALHFADRQHALQSEPVPRQPAPTPSTRRHSDRPSSSRTATPQRPATFAERLFQLHSSLAPYAGLIVTLALIASAGLLYWMIVGPANVPATDFDNYGFEFQQPTFSNQAATTNNVTDAGDDGHYVPQFTAELPHAEQSTTNSNDALSSSTHSESPPSEAPTLLPQPTESMPPLQPPAPSDSPYPKTSAYEPLDFTKVYAAPMGLPQTDVARRPTQSTNR